MSELRGCPGTSADGIVGGAPAGRVGGADGQGGCVPLADGAIERAIVLVSELIDVFTQAHGYDMWWGAEWEATKRMIRTLNTPRCAPPRQETDELAQLREIADAAGWFERYDWDITEGVDVPIAERLAARNRLRTALREYYDKSGRVHGKSEPERFAVGDKP